MAAAPPDVLTLDLHSMLACFIRLIVGCRFFRVGNDGRPGDDIL